MKRQMSDTLFIGIMLAVVGGFLDAYTYICRDGVFANAQTGNMVLLGMKIVKGEYEQVAAYFLPIFMFFIGILIAEVIKHHFLSHPKIHWRQIVLIIEIFALIIVAFVPQGYGNFIVNMTVSFVCSLQVESFRKFNGNPYASTMCTGNLRSATENLYQYCLTRDKKTLLKSLQYYMIIFFFIAGASLGAVLTIMLSTYAVLVTVILLLIVTLFMFIEQVG